MVLAIACSSGCTQSIDSPSAKNRTIPAPTTPPTASPSKPNIQPHFTTIAPKEVVQTLGPLKTIKDSELWFTMQVPESWNVTTERIPNPGGYEGLTYITHLYDGNVFYIITYAITRGQDQDIRNYFRASWTPLPNESTVTINGITFDRFESKSYDNIDVAYVVKKSSANERGFASLIEYSLNSSSKDQQKNFESFISTFQYKGAKEIKSATGEEIKRLE